jgi:hypothetical protein
MMLGLAAPAYAAAPVVTSFTPNGGPAAGGCVVVVTGTGLDDFAAATVEFVVTDTAATIDLAAAADYAIISDTEAWVAAPPLSIGFAYNIRVTNAGGTSTSTGTFLASSGAGACAPTITSFTPTCGGTGTTVVLTGTNLLRDFPVGGVNAGTIVGGIASFANYAADAAHTIPDVDEDTTLSVVTPSGSADGPIKVTTSGTTAVPLNGMSAFSTANFLVPPPDCTPETGNTHARAITFKIKKTGKTSGVVSSTEDPAFTDCVAAVPVKIQRKTNSGWKTVGKATTTDTGSYTKKVKNPKGKQKFRALAPKVSLGDPVTDVCSKAKSATRKI